MRAFVAIELPEACRSALVDATAVLKPLAGGVRWVRPEGLHLTLKFIGELDEVVLPAAIACLEAVAAEAGGFTMSVSGLSAFPPRGVPRVVHVGVQESTGALASLQRAVEGALQGALNIPPEIRPFAPHITLGRVRERGRCPLVEEMSEALPKQDFGRVDVDSFVLMRSELRPDGAVYVAVQRFRLGAA